MSAAVATLAGERRADARKLDREEMARLARGELVRVPLDVDLAKGDYFGGVSYAAIQATPADVMRVLTDPATYTSILPLTLEARVVGKVGDDHQVYFKQGGRLGAASYVLVVRRESPSLIRFWLDPSHAHDIDDCWGYFRVDPWGRRACLLTYAALLHLDFGPVKLLFTEKIRQYALGTPGLVRAYVRSHAAGPHDG